MQTLLSVASSPSVLLLPSHVLPWAPTKQDPDSKMFRITINRKTLCSFILFTQLPWILLCLNLLSLPHSVGWGEKNGLFSFLCLLLLLFKILYGLLTEWHNNIKTTSLKKSTKNVLKHHRCGFNTSSAPSKRHHVLALKWSNKFTSYVFMRGFTGNESTCTKQNVSLSIYKYLPATWIQNNVSHIAMQFVLH